jgi:hypothetical protein
VEEVRAGVLIVMPDRTYPHCRGDVKAGVVGSRPGSWQPHQQAVAGGSRPASTALPSGHCPSASVGTAATAVVGEEGRKELPELVLGVVGFGVERVMGEGEGGGEVGTEVGKGKEVERMEPGAVTL